MKKVQQRPGVILQYSIATQKQRDAKLKAKLGAFHKRNASFRRIFLHFNLVDQVEARFLRSTPPMKSIGTT
jgi:hypothetical protein